MVFANISQVSLGTDSPCLVKSALAIGRHSCNRCSDISIFLHLQKYRASRGTFPAFGDEPRRGVKPFRLRSGYGAAKLRGSDHIQTFQANHVWGFMRAIQRTLLVLVSVAVLSACAAVKHQAMKLAPGDSKAHVLEIMGAPDDRQFNGQDEALQYGMVVSIGMCDYTVVWLHDGKTSGVTSYRHFSTMGCRQGLKAINWSEAPIAAASPSAG